MPTTLAFKDLIDQPLWRPEAPTFSPSVAGASLCCDLTNSASRNPYFYFMRSNTIFEAFNPLQGDWITLPSPALAGTFGAGAASVFHPSQGPRGLIAASGTTTVITLSTALPAAVAVNQLANHGDGGGYTIRIITNAATSAGKIEERTIIANTAGTTPTLTLSSALSSAPIPAGGDTYEILCGRVFLLGAGTLTSGMFKRYDVATNNVSGNLATTSLPATVGTDSAFVAMSELYVPNNRTPGTGFLSGAGTYNGGLFNCIVATATTSTTITGAGMVSQLQANEYRNFQVRIVEDTGTPTAVGQRRRISSHTAGAAGVFTLYSAWTVTPSATAKFVVENWDDQILLRTSAATSLYTYNITADTWDTTSFAAPVANGAGTVAAQAFGVPYDVTGNNRHSFIHFIRGGVSSIDVLDIAGAATGTWANAVVYQNQATTFTTGTTGVYNGATQNGNYLYLNVSGTQRNVRYDMVNRTLEPDTYLRFPVGTATVGCRMAISYFIDGATKVPFVYQIASSLTNVFSKVVSR